MLSTSSLKFSFKDQSILKKNVSTSFSSESETSSEESNDESKEITYPCEEDLLMLEDFLATNPFQKSQHKERTSFIQDVKF